MNRRWRALVGIVGLVGLAVAAYSSVGDVREQVLPSAGALAAGLALQLVALYFAARSWVVLFPPEIDRAVLARGAYTSQLTKYLPAGGVMQATSQVVLSSQGGVASAAVRLPIFSLAAVVAAATLGAGLALDGDLALWLRMLAALGLATTAALDRRIIQGLLRAARKVTKRIPEPSDLPSQRAILQCYAAQLVNMLATALSFAVLLRSLTDVPLWQAVVAYALAWGVGYLVVPVPSGLGVREAVLVAALPGLATGSLLAASVAQRLLTLISEATLTGGSHGRAVLNRRHRPSRPTSATTAR